MICYSVVVAVLGACAPAPLAGACLQPPHPCSPDAGGGVFHSIGSGPLPRFFWCLACGFAFFFALRLPVPLGFVSLCYVSQVRRAVGRGFFASLSGGFWGRVSGGLGVAWLCFRSSMKLASSSILLAFLQINS